MTKEQASIIIGNIPINSDTMDDCYSITEYQEAKTMAIKALEQKPKTGKWRVYPVNYNNAFMCDSCHRLVVTPSDFCPNCGADMRGEE